MAAVAAPGPGEHRGSGPAVSNMPEAVQTPPAERQPERRFRWAPWLVLCCYLLAAVAVTARLWADPASRVQLGDPHDVDLFAWYLRYAATAVSHGRLPALFTTALNPPQGVNLMWNTSLLLPGILLTPVTLLAGPQTSLTVVLTLSLAGSAAALFLLLRRWGASILAAGLGGAVYGFSPAVINSGLGHYHLVFAVFPPLMIDALLRLLTGRGAAVWTGAWLGLLIGAQVFIGEEMLVYTAVACVVLTLVLAVQRPRAVVKRAGPVALGLAVTLAVALVICGHALWVQFRGPQVEHHPGFAWSTNLSFFVTPGGNVLFHTPASATVVARAHLGPPEVLAYLGWPLIAVLALAIVCCWRDARVRAAGITFLALELCSLGGGNQPHVSGRLLPWHWLQGLPAVTSVLPDRFAILADGAAAAVLAFSLDRARAALRDRGRGRGRDRGRAGTGTGAGAGAGGPRGSRPRSRCWRWCRSSRCRTRRPSCRRSRPAGRRPSPGFGSSRTHACSWCRSRTSVTRWRCAGRRTPASRAQ